MRWIWIALLCSTVALLTTEALPWQLVTRRERQEMREEIEKLRYEIAVLRGEVKADGTWMWKQRAGTLERGAYDQKTGVSRSPH